MASSARTALTSLVLVASALAASACGGTGSYVWFDALPQTAANVQGDYVIGVGDTVDIKALNHEEMNVKEKVRPDGRIAVPLVGEVEARGKRPSALKAELEGRLKDFMVQPSLTVNVEDVRPMTVLILGEVMHPGPFEVERNATLAQALALGGGLTEYASKDSIYVVRHEPQPMRIRFTYQAVLRDEAGAGRFPLHPGDQVEVE